jgi:hypothetical protein
LAEVMGMKKYLADSAMTPFLFLQCSFRDGNEDIMAVIPPLPSSTGFTKRLFDCESQ